MTAFTAELPPWPVGGRPDPMYELSCAAYDTSLIAALRARLALAVDALEGALDTLVAHSALYPKGEAEVIAIIAACREPNHNTQGNDNG